VTYSKYDARGHAERKVDGPNDLTFTYDRAERLKQVDATGGNILKVFTYGTSNAAGTRTNGRLESAQRYNYVGTLCRSACRCSRSRSRRCRCRSA
jgi:YD repeat-containing protein